MVKLYMELATSYIMDIRPHLAKYGETWSDLVDGKQSVSSISPAR